MSSRLPLQADLMQAPDRCHGAERLFPFRSGHYWTFRSIRPRDFPVAGSMTSNRPDPSPRRRRNTIVPSPILVSTTSAPAGRATSA